MIKLLKRNKFLISILVLALGLRLIAIDQSFWMDEAISGKAVKYFSFWEIITKYIPADTHPPLYYLILKLWTNTSGYSEISLRFPSVIFGLLTIYFVYKIGNKLKKGSGLIAAFLLATAPLHIYYSQEARMYSLTTLLVSMCVYYLIERKWMKYALCLLFLGMNDYLPLVILPVIWIYRHFNEKFKDIWPFILSHVPLTLFYFLWFPVFLSQGRSTASYLMKFPEWASVLGGANVKDLALVWVKFMIGRVGFENKYVYGFMVMILSISFGYLLLKSLKNFKKHLLVWLWYILPIVITFVGAVFIPGFSYFRLIFALPAFYLLIAFGIKELNNKKIIIGVLMSTNLIFTFMYLFNQKFWREDWKTAVPFVENRLTNEEVVLVSYPNSFTPYLWYSKKPGKIMSFDSVDLKSYESIYTLDYLMDLTDFDRKNYEKLKNSGFSNTGVYNFRGVGQVRYWQK